MFNYDTWQIKIFHIKNTHSFYDKRKAYNIVFSDWQIRNLNAGKQDMKTFVSRDIVLINPELHST